MNTEHLGGMRGARQSGRGPKDRQAARNAVNAVQLAADSSDSPDGFSGVGAKQSPSSAKPPGSASGLWLCLERF